MSKNQAEENVEKIEEEGTEDTGNVASLSDDLTKLETELQTLRQEKDELYNRMLRIQADFDNFRRRSRQEYEQACLYGGEELLKKILPVLDSLERAVDCFNEQNPENHSWQEGVQLTLRQFQNILSTEGLVAVESVNQPFDPQVHEAMMQETSTEVTEPIVVMELQKGYKYKDKLIRPALVKVAVPQ